ncbi:uncharacterized protein [Nerophis lumbriciformis]|uniref:uncharacterized protein n=1 Tax=Nerophis lumbriciformis TaxID=546530 RepID=UPI002ADF3116|nr:uncharacterized protein LOC133611596 [Nerophis lumbriciformis]
MPAPRKSPTSEEFEEMRFTLHSLCGDMTAVREHQEQLLGLLEEVKQLRLQNVEKDRRIVDLERRVDELEQYSRMNDVVITSVKIKPRSYARAVAADSGEPSVQEIQSVEQQVASYLQSRGIEMDLEHIEDCHPLPMRNQRPPAVIMRFTNRKKKIALIKQGRKLKVFSSPYPALWLLKQRSLIRMSPHNSWDHCHYFTSSRQTVSMSMVNE